MKQQDKFLLGFYIGQEIVIHPKHGKYILDGFYTKGIFAKRNLTGKPEDEECEMFDFSEVKFDFKPINQSLLKRYSDSIRFIKHISKDGAWVGDQSIFKP